MGPILLALLLTSPQAKPVPKGPGAKAAMQRQVQETHNEDANRFLMFVRSIKTLSVHMSLHRPDRPTDGEADLVLARPGKLFYHLTWGPEDYTFAILNGQAIEIDRGIKLYDTYPSPGWQPPEANGSDWVDSCFPMPFVNESDLVPKGSVDAESHLTTLNFSEGDPPVKTTLKFSDYKTNFDIPDSKFAVKPPAGFSAYSVDRLVPPHSIGEVLPPASLADGSGRSVTLGGLLHGKPGLIAIVDPESEISLGSLAVVKKVKGIKVLLVNLNPAVKGFRAGSIPVLHDPQGKIGTDWRVGATPMFYLVDGKGKITNVWYGFDRNKADRFATQISDAVGDMSD
jgi:hypothetical protein